MQTARISILGCGWLGVPLAHRLLDLGFSVKGSVTSHTKLKSLQEQGIEPYRLVLDADRVQLKGHSFFDTDLVIVAFPPRRIEFIETIFPAQIKQLIGLLEKYRVPKVLFISSTSVYNEQDGVVTEDDVTIPEKGSGKALALSEFLLTQNKSFQTTVLRFGGLIGADRNPARFLSRKKEAISGDKPVNLIHLDDCIGIIESIIQRDIWGETFNACSPVHPSRSEFYTKASEVSGLDTPLFNNEKATFKVVDSSKLIHLLNYQFQYPSPMDYLEAAK